MRTARRYFPRPSDSPDPLTAVVSRCVSFHEVDMMGIVWHGNYAALCEDASSELRRRCGLACREFYDAGIQAPIVRLQIDYLQALFLDDAVTISATLIWSDAARLNIEYCIARGDGGIVATGFTVQLFTVTATGEVCIIPPPLLARFRERWRNGEFKFLQ
jgi:acyl-CoA thioester hydrolase